MEGKNYWLQYIEVNKYRSKFMHNMIRSDNWKIGTNAKMKEARSRLTWKKLAKLASCCQEQGARCNM
jgi:hypothetical protein